jgi:hypothetical protein
MINLEQLSSPKRSGAEGEIRTRELLRDRDLSPAPLTWLGNLRLEKGSLRKCLLTVSNSFEKCPSVIQHLFLKLSPITNVLGDCATSHGFSSGAIIYNPTFFYHSD